MNKKSPTMPQRDYSDFAEGPTSGWRTIETAPKDGRQVLLYPSPWLTRRDEGMATGWWAQGSQVWVSAGDVLYPTHWMPLPVPPGGKA